MSRSTSSTASTSRPLGHQVRAAPPGRSDLHDVRRHHAVLGRSGEPARPTPRRRRRRSFRCADAPGGAARHALGCGRCPRPGTALSRASSSRRLGNIVATTTAPTRMATISRCVGPLVAVEERGPGCRDDLVGVLRVLGRECRRTRERLGQRGLRRVGHRLRGSRHGRRHRRYWLLASTAPRMDCMMAPPRSRCRSAVPDAMPARATGTDPVSECDEGVPAKPTPAPMHA